MIDGPYLTFIAARHGVDAMRQAEEELHHKGMLARSEAIFAEGAAAERARIRRELLAALPGIEAGVAMALDDALSEKRMAADLFVTDNRNVLHDEVFGGVYAALDRICPE